MSCNTRPRKQLELIQTIRGLAAVLVVYFHTTHVPSFGAFGVDLFFVLSGAVMAMLMDESPHPWGFMCQRLARILPLYFIMTTVAAVISWTLPHVRSSGDIPTLSNYILSLCFIPHVTATGSLAPVLSVGWTLNYEMMFYLICAASLCVARKSAHVVAAIVVVCICLIAQAAPGESAVVRFISNPIVLEFVMGVVVWRGCNVLAGNQSWSWLLGLFGALLAIICAELALPMSATDPVGWRRPFVFGTLSAVIIFCALRGETAYLRAPRGLVRAASKVGDASYAIYLTHLFVVGIAKIACARTGFGSVGTSLVAFLTTLSSVALGILVHRWIDSPLQRRLRMAAVSAK